MTGIAKKINDWVTKYIIHIYILLGVVMLVHACVMYHLHSFDGIDRGSIIVLATIATLYIVCGAIIAKTQLYRRYIIKLWQEMDRCYFHGFKFRRYVETFAFWRFQEWLGSGRCYAFSSLVMIVLKHNKTATLCRGSLYDKYGNFRTRHSWIEFKIPMNGWWVADFSWINECFCSKKEYLKVVNADGERLELKWSCTYKEFWDTPLAKALYEAMKNPETSYTYNMLGAFGSPKDEWYGFTKYCYSEKVVEHAACRRMVPFMDCDNKPIASRIIRDFVKNYKRKQPKARSIRLAYAGIKYVERMKEST